MHKLLSKHHDVLCVFLGESKNGFVIADHMDSSPPKNKRSEKGLFTKTTAYPRSPRDDENGGKKQQTNPRGEDKKKKQHRIGKKYFFQILSPKKAQIMNLKNPDLNLIRRIHPECGFYRFMIRFWICPKKAKSVFGSRNPDLDFPQKTHPV